jgi:hypothetical protein
LDSLRPARPKAKPKVREFLRDLRAIPSGLWAFAYYRRPDGGEAKRVNPLLGAVVARGGEYVRLFTGETRGQRQVWLIVADVPFANCGHDECEFEDMACSAGITDYLRKCLRTKSGKDTAVYSAGWADAYGLPLDPPPAASVDGPLVCYAGLACKAAAAERNGTVVRDLDDTEGDGTPGDGHTLVVNYDAHTFAFVPAADLADVLAGHREPDQVYRYPDHLSADQVEALIRKLGGPAGVPVG